MTTQIGQAALFTLLIIEANVHIMGFYCTNIGTKSRDMCVENPKEYARRCASDPELRAKAKEFGLTDMDAHMQQPERLNLDWT